MIDSLVAYDMPVSPPPLPLYSVCSRLPYYKHIPLNKAELICSFELCCLSSILKNMCSLTPYCISVRILDSELHINVSSTISPEEYAL